jgi:hypothetical protein
MRQAQNTVVFFLFLLFAACNGQVERVSKVDPLANEPLPEVPIMRFDQAIIGMDTNQLEKSIKDVEAAFPLFYPFFVGPGFTHLTDPREPEEINKLSLRGYLTNQPTRILYDSVQLVYNNMSDVETDIAQLMRAWRHYQPTAVVPQVISIVSEFSTAAFTYGDSLAVVSLDFFLGAHDPHYQLIDPPLPQYITRALDKNHLPVYLAEAMVNNRFGSESMDNRMISQMLHNGKKQYLLSRLLAFKPDSVIWRFSESQTNWCYANESKVWAYFVQQELLFSTARDKYRKFVGESPDSPGMPAEAPGRTGNFIGWQIIEQFMEKYPDYTIEKLFALTDPQKILEMAEYNPRK